MSQSCTEDGYFNVSLTLLPLTTTKAVTDHYASMASKPTYVIRWIYKGQVVSEWDDLPVVTIPQNQQRGRRCGDWEVRVSLKTGFVRKDEGNTLQWSESLDVKKCPLP